MLKLEPNSLTQPMGVNYFLLQTELSLIKQITFERRRNIALKSFLVITFCAIEEDSRKLFLSD